MKPFYLLALPLLAFAADNWQPFAFDKHVSVKLPATPFDMTEDAGVPAGTHVYAAQSGSSAYQITGPVPTPPALQVQDARARSLYYDGVVKGLVQEQGNALVARSPFATVAGEGVAVTYTSPATADSKEMTLYSRTFLVGRNMYTLTYFRTDGGQDGGDGRRFFDSLTVKP